MNWGGLKSLLLNSYIPAIYTIVILAGQAENNGFGGYICGAIGPVRGRSLGSITSHCLIKEYRASRRNVEETQVSGGNLA